MAANRVHRAYAVSAFVLVLALVCAASPCRAQDTKTPEIAPPNPEFVRYLQEASSGRLQALSQDGYSLGLVPSPVDLSHIKGISLTSGRQILSLPTSYDLRTTGKLTAIRNQGGCGSCWAFAAYGSMESCLMPGEPRDFSENNLKNLAGFDISCCDGGNQYMTAAYLGRWSGPVNETSDPYNAGSCTSPAGTTIQKHVQDILFLPDRSGYADNDTIKQAVMTYGAVYTSMYWGDGYYNSGNYSYYYRGTPVYPSNHAVCIVGWDDSYDKARFATQPAGNGAFIVRNSWGSGWGQSGYFYVSYYDANVGRDNAVFNGNQAVTNYDRVYQYDPLGWVSSVGYGSTTAWGANVFTAVQDGRVSAVSFYAASPGTAYDIYIHISPNSGPINTAGWAARTTGTVSDAGYHTIPVGALVMVAGGQRFSAVVKLTTPGLNYPVPMECPEGGYSSAATANAGESYISSNGSSWSDITGSFSNTNVCIKAFSSTNPGLVVTPETNLAAAGPVGGPMGQYGPSSITYTLSNTASTSINWTAAKTQPWVTLSATGGTIAAGGSAQVTVSVNSGADSLPAGVYGDTVSLTNTTNGIGNTTRAVVLTVRNAQLAVTPSQAYEPAGAVGGPFTPTDKVYTISNTGYSNLYWSASKTQPWISLSATGGVVHPNEQAQVTVSINSGANGLPIGTYSDTVVFTNTANGDGNTSRAVNLSVCRNYALLPAGFAWVDPTAHTAIALTDDGVSTARALPFTFTFYDQQYTQVYVGANGLIGFGGSGGLSDYANTDIPSAGVPNAVLYPYWDDLDPSSVGSVKVGTEGTSPNRRYVISWVGVPHYSTPSAPLTFQVVLHETGNDITFQYLQVQAGDSYGAGRSATVGVEDSAGRIAKKYSYDGSVLLSNNQAFNFTMNPPLSIADAKRQPNSAAVVIRGAVVTGVFGSSFSIEADDRSSGILVYKPSHGMAVGMRADVSGTLSTNVYGEKYISATSVAQNGTGAIEPMLLINRGIGGADWEYDSSTGAGQKGIKGAIDLNNIGMLVCTAGKVTYVGTNFFYVDDGSGAKDTTSYKGVKVTVSGLTLPALNKFVTVCGVSSCSKTGSDLYRLIRATSIAVAD